MKIYNRSMLDDYLKNDWIMGMLSEMEHPEDNSYRTHQWLKQMDNKRMIYADMYGDFLKHKSDLKVLDVGGGYTSLTKKLAQNVDYTLLDYMAHENAERITGLCNGLGYSCNIVIDDWYNYELDKNYDVIVCNDLFPDADQRMELFIDRFIPNCREMRLLLTFYNTPKFYTTKRVDDTEMLTFLSYDGEILRLKLKKYSNISDVSFEDLDCLVSCTESIFYNGRQTCYIVLKGGLSLSTCKNEG